MKDKQTKLIRIDAGWHKFIKLKATSEGKSVKNLVEELFGELSKKSGSGESTKEGITCNC